MLSGILGFFSGVGKAIGAALGALVEWAAIIGAYFLGRRRAERDTLEEVAEAKDEQLEILSRPTRHRDSLLNRMRSRKRH